MKNNNIIIKAGMGKHIFIITVICFLAVGYSAFPQGGGISINTNSAPADPSALLDVSSTNAGILVPRMTEVQKSAIPSPATGLMIYQIDGSAGFWYFNGTTWVQSGNSSGITGPTGPTGPTGYSTLPAHYVGELYGGGIIFYVYDNGNHGLITSLTDLSTGGYPWSNIYNVLIGTTNSWDGSSNTNAIINQPGHTSSAALLCKNYTGGGYNDWYLPSIDEMNLMFDSRFIINKTLGANGLSVDAEYWTSTETGVTQASRWRMTYADAYPNDKNITWYYVRAARTF